MTDHCKNHRDYTEELIGPYQKRIAEEVASLKSEWDQDFFTQRIATIKDINKLSCHILELGLIEIQIDELKEKYLKVCEDIINRRKEIFFRDKGVDSGRSFTATIG